MFPFTQDYELDEAGIRHNVEYMIASKSAGIGFGFSEPWVCTLAERKRLMEISVDAVKGRVPAYLRTSAPSAAKIASPTGPRWGDSGARG